MIGFFLTAKPEDFHLAFLNQAGTTAVFVGYRSLDHCWIDKARKIGLKIYVEIGISAGQEWWHKYPDSRPVDSRGRLMPAIAGYGGVCPTHSGVRREQLERIAKILDSGVDGIWLDFIRFPCRWETVRSSVITEYCFCPNCRQAFNLEKQLRKTQPRKLTNKTSEVNSIKAHLQLIKDDNDYGETWTTWKCSQITSFVAAVRALITQSNRRVILGLFGVPWKEHDYGGAIRKIIGQDFLQLADLVDVFTPMTYHVMLDRDPDWIHKYVIYLFKLTGKPVWPIIQTEDKPRRLTASELDVAVSTAQKSPSEGVIIFFLEDLLNNPEKANIFLG